MKRLALLLLVLAACKHEEQVGTISGPPLLIASSAPIVDASSPPPRAPAAPLSAAFVEYDAGHGATTEKVECEQRIFAIVGGRLSIVRPSTDTTIAAGATGDVITLDGAGSYDVHGTATVVRANLPKPDCTPENQIDPRTFPGRAVKPLTWAGGRMHASLMVEKGDAKLAYVGFLDGTAPVAEHVHEGSWEILCASTAKGTFTLGGAPQRLVDRQCVAIPPATKHSWTPDPDSRLAAVQFYVPAGPEQRFRGLDAAEHDR